LKGFFKRANLVLILCLFVTQYMYGQIMGDGGSLIAKNEINPDRPFDNSGVISIEPGKSPSVSAVRFYAEYTVQVGAFSHKQNALKMYKIFKTAGFNVDIYQNYLDGKPLLYLVWVGSYKSFDDVNSAQNVIKIAYNIEGVIRERSVWPK